MVPFLTDLDTPWREPRQDRSRERVAAILGAARELIAGGGLAALKMVPLARRAGVPVGTIYQFFADKDAIIGRIFASQLEADLQEIDQACNPGHDLESPAAAAATAVVSSKYREWRSDPVMAEIWSIAQANRTLRALAMEASRATADIEVRALKRYLRPGVGKPAVAGLLRGPRPVRVRRADRRDLPANEAPALLEEYAAMVNQHIASLLC